MKKFLSLTLCLLLCLTFFVSCDDTPVKDTATDSETDAPFIAPKYSEIDRSEVSSLDGVEETSDMTDYVLIDVKDFGKILVRLYPDVAPKTVENFKKLVSESFYDGLIFHRVIKNFMVQGGGFTPDMKEKDADSIYGEFRANGFVNNLKHTRGVLSMARTEVYNSASSQFFICHKTSGCQHLDGSYASFGYVVYGMDVVDEIAKVSTSADVPTTDVIINSIRFVTFPEQTEENTNETNA